VGDQLAGEKAVERDRLCSFLEKGKAILSPVRRLPRELLEFVMEHSTDAVGVDVTASPWRFTHVSRLWRETAVGLPSLWKVIQVNTTKEPTSPGVLELVKLILTRSRNVHLSVTLSFLHCGGVLGMLNMDTRLTSLTLEDRRYIHSSDPVILCLPNLRRLATSDNIISIGGEFPELRELFLHENFGNTWRHIVDNILSNSVKLQFLTLSEWGYSTSFDSDPLLRILNFATPLKVLRLFPRGRPQDQNEDAIFSLIARLTLGHVDNIHLSHPVLPNLTNLILHLPNWLAYDVRLISGHDMRQEILTRASGIGVSPDIQKARLRRIWIQDGDCKLGTSKLEKISEEQIDGGVDVCIARPLVPAFGWEVGLAVLSSSAEICSALTNYA
jgi:hypothetical protein